MSQAQTLLASPDLLTLLPLGVLLVTRQHVVTYANNMAEDMLGESTPYLHKRKFNEIFHPAEKLIALINKAFSKNSPLKEYDFTLSGPRFGTRLVTLHVMPINAQEALICFDDSSNANTLGQSARQRTQVKTQGNMAAILAHEVKNPLAGIRGAAQLLHKTVRPEDRELTTLICNETDRIKSVVEEMEFFSNPSDLKTENMNIHEALHYARTLVEKSGRKNVTFVEKFDPSLPPVKGNANLLVQAFINLLKNAMEVTEEKTIIKLSTSYNSGATLRIGNSPSNSKLPIVISIEDDGSGIPPELRETLFDPFVTSKKTGKGLGLAIVAKIIADHGGVIELDPRSENGARFNLFLPVA